MAIPLALLFALAQPAAASPPLPWPAPPPLSQALSRAATLTTLGRTLFHDPGLSASGRMACATCHDPAFAFSPANPLPVQRGGPDLDQPGTRAVPGLAYLSFRPAFTDHFHDAEDDDGESIDAGPTGGLNWDGRVNRVRDQAAIPLLSPNEMANRTPADLVARMQAAPYAATLRALHGDDIFSDTAKTFAAITEALEFYLQDPIEFSPFTSKYDAVLRHQTTLTATEQRGLAAFNDPARGNCAQCHRSHVSKTGHPPLFTDFGLIALGVPRNQVIPANADPAHTDLGLCGPDRRDHPASGNCGRFMTPSLRNVARRQSFFHNGIIHTLREAVAFYAQRDTAPAKWYPTDADGTIRKYDDLPAAYHANVNSEPPFGQRTGDTPPLSAPEIDDIVTFLQTLTDGYRAGKTIP